MSRTAEDKMVEELRDVNRALSSLQKNILIGTSRIENVVVKTFDTKKQMLDCIRPCYISKKSFKNGPKKAIFHGWIELKSPNMTQTLALVEYEDGVVEQVKPTSVIFTDSKWLFDEFYWDEEDGDEETEDTVQIETEEQTDKSGDDDQ